MSRIPEGNHHRVFATSTEKIFLDTHGGFNCRRSTERDYRSLPSFRLVFMFFYLSFLLIFARKMFGDNLVFIIFFLFLISYMFTISIFGHSFQFSPTKRRVFHFQVCFSNFWLCFSIFKFCFSIFMVVFLYG